VESLADQALSIARGDLGDDVVVAVALKPRQRFAPVFAVTVVGFALVWFAAQGVVGLLGRIAGSIVVTVALLAVLAGLMVHVKRSALARILCRRSDGRIVLVEHGVWRPDRVEVEAVRPPLRAGDLDESAPVPVEVNGRRWTVVPAFVPQLRAVLGRAPIEDP
jgi:hypothetical protein